MSGSRYRIVFMTGILLVACALSSGCISFHKAPIYVPPYVPRELETRPLAEYVIEPPDVLAIDALRLVPKGPYKIEPLDTLYLRVTNTFRDEPIDGPFPVDTDGTIDLGLTYGGKIKVVDLTLDEAKAAIDKQLSKHLKGHKIEIGASPSKAIQQVRGNHLVRPDGAVGLGSYGSVRVAGLTIEEAKLAIEARLATDFLKPEISLNVVGFNSKLYYVILDGAGFGEQVYRLPVTGNETVLDAVAQVFGLLPVSNKRQIWIARPSCGDEAEDQVLEVDWVAVSQRGKAETNYQLRPGDRLYINSEPLITLDTWLARVISPVERIFGVTLLGATTYQAVRNPEQFFGTGNQ